MSGSWLRLRQVMSEGPGPDAERDGPPVIVVGSGKGGVGKSVFSVLLAGGLADRGQRVLLVDGSQNLGHLQVLVGVAVQGRLEALARGETAADALVHQVNERLWLLPSESGAEGLYAMGALESARLHHRLCDLYDGYDLVVVDAGPGVEGVIRLATMRGTRIVVVTVPEAAALTDAYALIKLVHLQLPLLPVDVLVNRAFAPEDASEAHGRLAAAAERFLGRSLGCLGALAEEPALREAVRHGMSLLTAPGLEPLRRQVAGLDLLADTAGASGSTSNAI